MKRQNGLSQEDLIQALADQGGSLEAFRERIKETIRQNKIITQEIKSKVAVTGTEIKDSRQGPFLEQSRR